MVYRNMIEFDAEEYNWENVAEVRQRRTNHARVYFYVICMCT